MKTDLTNLLPSVTLTVVNKILIVEVYFLLKSGRSPAYFSLIDFVDNHSIELLYLAIFFAMLPGWIFLPAIALYYLVAGILSLLGSKFMAAFRYQGIPLFKALSEDNTKKRISIAVALDYSQSNSDLDLQTRIEKHTKETNEALANEALAATNFALVGLIACITFLTDAPNFLMKVTSFADPYICGLAYEACLIMLAIQGLFGRATAFPRLRDSGTLPPSFFKSEDERKKVEAWVQQMVERHKPLAQKWIGSKK